MHGRVRPGRFGTTTREEQKNNNGLLVRSRALSCSYLPSTPHPIPSAYSRLLLAEKQTTVFVQRNILSRPPPPSPDIDLSLCCFLSLPLLLPPTTPSFFCHATPFTLPYTHTHAHTNSFRFRKKKQAKQRTCQTCEEYLATKHLKKKTKKKKKKKQRRWKRTRVSSDTCPVLTPPSFPTPHFFPHSKEGTPPPPHLTTLPPLSPSCIVLLLPFRQRLFYSFSHPLFFLLFPYVSPSLPLSPFLPLATCQTTPPPSQSAYSESVLHAHPNITCLSASPSPHFPSACTQPLLTALPFFLKTHFPTRPPTHRSEKGDKRCPPPPPHPHSHTFLPSFPLPSPPLPSPHQ